MTWATMLSEGLGTLVHEGSRGAVFIFWARVARVSHTSLRGGFGPAEARPFIGANVVGRGQSFAPTYGRDACAISQTASEQA